MLPPPPALERAQDRLVEKTFLNEVGVETAPYRAVDNDTDLACGLAGFGGSGVLKTRRLGYDGKGQSVLRGITGNGADGTYAQMGNVPLVLEGLIPFVMEVSVIAARGRDGSMAAFDIAQNVHRDGILATSTVPATVSKTVAKAAENAAFRVLEALDYAGVIGVEFFVLEDDSLLANEFCTTGAQFRPLDRSGMCGFPVRTAYQGRMRLAARGYGASFGLHHGKPDWRGCRSGARASQAIQCGAAPLWQSRNQTRSQDGSRNPAVDKAGSPDFGRQSCFLMGVILPFV